jgi:hypothetical protein
MQRPELDPVLHALELLEDRTISKAKGDAWQEILHPHTQADALAAVRAFHSKPYKRPAYPGDIKALILEKEDVRLRRCGSIDVNEVEWFDGPPTAARARLRRLIATDEWSPEDYRLYQRSALKLDEYLAKQGELVG